MFLTRSILARDEALRFLNLLPQRWLAANRTFEKRQAILEEGSCAECMHVVERGWVKLTRTLPDGSVRGLGIVGPGSVIGLEASATYFSSAIALTPTKTYAVPQTVAWSSGEASNSLLSQIISQFIHMQSYVAILGISTAEQRLAAFLVGVSAYCGEAEDGTLKLPMRRDDISEFLGIRPETVSRRIMDFHRKGWIEVSARFDVRVLQPEVLRKFSSDFGLENGAA